jgi:hypothetical protein
MAALATFDALSPASIAGEAPAGFCAFCGFAGPGAARFISTTAHDGTAVKQTACLLCAAIQDLGRPTIDYEALVIWMPEISQAALNRLVRGLQITLLTDVKSPAFPAPQAGIGGPATALYRVLAARQEGAVGRVGTASPSLLARAAAGLQQEARHARRLVPTGLRVLHLGRHFAGGRDIYPDAVRQWASSQSASK